MTHRAINVCLGAIYTVAFFVLVLDLYFWRA